MRNQQSSQLEPEVIWHDDHLVVISKPAGMVSMKGQTVIGRTVQDWFSDWMQDRPSEFATSWQQWMPEDFSDEFGTPDQIFSQRGGVVHRLDKDTSGVLLLARHPASLVALLRLFKERLVQKEYICLVHGKFQIKTGTFSGPIGRASYNRVRFAVQADGRPAVTKYQVEADWSSLDVPKVVAVAEAEQREVGVHFKKRAQIYQGFSQVRCWPKTGRTHQIRVHLAAAQHPLVGDSLYTGKKRQQLDKVWCPRQFLHAAVLEFTHPVTRKEIRVSAPLPVDLSTALEFLS